MICSYCGFKFKKALIGLECALIACALLFGTVGCASHESSNNDSSMDSSGSSSEESETTEPSDLSGISSDTQNVNIYDILQTNSEGFVIFGQYEQDGNLSNGKEPIEWIVLDENSNGVLLISRYVLDAVAYNDNSDDITWADCTLRKWLNDSFLYDAFNNNQRLSINSVTLENADNIYYETEGGANTTDKVFCLSVSEIAEYYNFDCWDSESYDGYSQSLLTPLTKFAEDNGTTFSVITQQQYDDGVSGWYAFGEFFKYYDSDCVGMTGTWWWLRSPGTYEYSACIVDGSGHAGDMCSWYVDDESIGVRPALYINLDAYASDNIQVDSESNTSNEEFHIYDDWVGEFVDYYSTRGGGELIQFFLYNSSNNTGECGYATRINGLDYGYNEKAALTYSQDGFFEWSLENHDYRLYPTETVNGCKVLMVYQNMYRSTPIYYTYYDTSTYNNYSDCLNDIKGMNTATIDSSSGGTSFRYGPGDEYEEIWMMDNGDQVVVEIEDTGTEWIQVKYMGDLAYLRGWVKRADVRYGATDYNVSFEGNNTEEENDCVHVIVAAPDGYVNFRTGPGTNYEIIMPIYNGEELLVVGEESGTNWIQVKYLANVGYLTGWVNRTQVQYENVYVVVAAPDGYVNFRTGPGTNYEVIMEIVNGEELLVIGEESGTNWIQVKYLANVGYMTGWVNKTQVKYK